MGIIDIDYFKKINDTYGHEIGDKVLKDTSNFLKEKIRKDDYIIRWGGEEFVILLKVKKEEEGIKKLNKIREEISEYELNIEKITISIGYSIIKNIENDLEEFIEKKFKEADKNLYKAKKSGRNKIFPPEIK